MAMVSCGVCCDAFNLSTRKKVVCNYCTFDVCTGCSEKYLLESSQDAHCMNCRHAWNREAMETIFSKKFVTVEYKNHRSNLMFQRQLSMLPETQPYVEIERQRLKYVGMEDVAKATLKIKKQAWRKFTESKDPVQMLPDELIEFTLVNVRFQQEISAIKIELAGYKRIMEIVTGKTVGERRKFVRACPADDCRGFLSTQWKCGLCAVNVCCKCHEIKRGDGEEHTCDPDAVATAELLSKDSKPCPECAALIFKVDGCDQMWCTQCHTAFSWRTGKTETAIHNPHYYDYMRQQNGGIIPREAGDVLPEQQGPCNDRRVPPLPCLINLTWRTERGDMLANVYKIHRLHIHIAQVEMHRFAQANIVNDNRDLRIKYMLKMLSEKEFKATLQQREKASDKKREITMVLQTYQAVVAETLTAMSTITDRTAFEAMYARIVDLRDYVNESLEKISARYGNVAPLISKTWQMTSTGLEKKAAAAEAKAAA